jgi:hypothetical protein
MMGGTYGMHEREKNSNVILMRKHERNRFVV